MGKFNVGDKVTFVLKKEGIKTGVIRNRRSALTLSGDNVVLYDIFVEKDNVLHKGIREALIDEYKE